jgi:hypothetical protein
MLVGDLFPRTTLYYYVTRATQLPITDETDAPAVETRRRRTVGQLPSKYHLSNFTYRIIIYIYIYMHKSAVRYSVKSNGIV